MLNPRISLRLGEGGTKSRHFCQCNQTQEPDSNPHTYGYLPHNKPEIHIGKKHGQKKPVSGQTCQPAQSSTPNKSKIST